MVPHPITRPQDGRWLGGVCAGLARRWDVPAAQVRLWFVLGAVLLGLSALVYVTAWLIFPSESEDGRGQRGIVLLAQACGALLALATLAGAGAAATVFGFGWVIVALAAAILVGTLAGWARLGPAWALLPIGALVLPSAALAVADVHVEPSTTSRVYTDLRPRYASGLGQLTIDLRRTALPTRGTIPITIDAGVRRTLVALPHDRCVHVEVSRQVTPVALQAAAIMLGRGDLGAPTATLFGGDAPMRRTRRPGPTLLIVFSTAGSELVVRDYPDDVDPRLNPDWPGYPVAVEERPTTVYLPRAERKRILAAWRERRDEQIADQRRIDNLMDGPCDERDR